MRFVNVTTWLKLAPRETQPATRGQPRPDLQPPPAIPLVERLALLYPRINRGAVVGRRLLEDQLVQAEEHVVIMGGLPIASRARTNFVKLQRV
jgi:hypothetical protein